MGIPSRGIKVGDIRRELKQYADHEIVVVKIDPDGVVSFVTLDEPTSEEQEE